MWLSVVAAVDGQGTMAKMVDLAAVVGMALEALLAVEEQELLLREIMEGRQQTPQVVVVAALDL